MMESVYSWRVWDELKAGKKVYGIALDGDVPRILCLHDCRIFMVHEFMQEHPSALYYTPEEVD